MIPMKLLLLLKFQVVPLYSNRKSYMETPTAPLDLTLNDLQRYMGGIYLPEELKLGHGLLLNGNRKAY